MSQRASDTSSILETYGREIHAATCVGAWQVAADGSHVVLGYPVEATGIAWQGRFYQTFADGSRVSFGGGDWWEVTQ